MTPRPGVYATSSGIDLPRPLDVNSPRAMICQARHAALKVNERFRRAVRNENARSSSFCSSVLGWPSGSLATMISAAGRRAAATTSSRSSTTLGRTARCHAVGGGPRGNAVPALDRLFIGIASGLPLGLLTSTSTISMTRSGALALGFQTLPSVLLGAAALLWFARPKARCFFVVVIGTVCPVLLAHRGGARNSPPIYLAPRATWDRKIRQSGRG